MSKPIDLIVANIMHDAFDLIQAAMAARDQALDLVKKHGLDPAQFKLDMPNTAEQIARKLLCEIAHEAPVSDVYTALASVKAPSSADLISEGLQAIKDRQPT